MCVSVCVCVCVCVCACIYVLEAAISWSSVNCPYICKSHLMYHHFSDSMVSVVITQLHC